MKRSLIYSLVGIIGLAIVALGACLATGDSPLLGLDLRGGVSVVLQPQGTANSAQLAESVSIIDRRVNGLGVANSQVQRQGKDVVINLPGIKDSQRALTELGTTATLYFRPVVCELPAFVASSASSASPSTTVPSTTVPSSSATTTPKALGAPVQARLTSAVLPAVTPTTAGSTPATTAPATPATTVPATTATTAPAAPAASTATPVSPNTPITAATAPQICSASNGSQIPSTTPAGDLEKSYVLVPASSGSGLGTNRFLLGPADLTGRAVKNAYVSVSSTGAYTVELQFTGEGSKQFDAMAAIRNKYYSASSQTVDPRSQEAIDLDGQVESAPTIQSAQFNGQASISGSFTSSQASALALVLKYGSLPVRFTPQSVQTVSATIGKDSLHAGLLAGAGGIIVVLLYMILYYRALGLVVVLGLAVGGALLYSMLTLLSQTSSLTLTLSSITGIIVSVGITVDSYVVYFERLKDEVRGGRTIRQSTERSFSRAFRTVLTADFVSFLAALILYLLTVGDVRGFAFTLGLSTLLDVATAYFFIRPMVIVVGRRRTFTENRILGVARGLGAAGGTG
ncbi:protein translocase subunit SecD [Acidiferrimicrobium sp. IK]|uniref:protein translocase subunit SecD n=1 Tax=Acidiferrimicrobium sp. IK TaxID=2871700 RepID=UPI0021CB4E39|nr:protein translocase subunit SecD [Acidiferrimicrobium sp. IK]MCU4184849.1 protein translocase subunit SecD [Acidiferrimicrobium sp. IK]